MTFSQTPLGKGVQKHPIITLGILCLLLAGVFTQAPTVSFLATAPLVVALLTLVCAVGVFPRTNLIITVALGGILALIWGTCFYFLNAPLPLSLGLVGLSLLLSIFLLLLYFKKLTPKRGVLLLFAAGFLLRLCYVLYTTVATRQHDVWFFSQGDFSVFSNQRHAEYVEYIATYLKLPVEDPTAVGLSQLYHPPFHHLIAGLWLRLNTAMGVEYTAACENIQLLTLFYSSAIMVITYKILRLLGCKGFSLFLPLSLVVFHPTFILMAGSVNNDLLSITLAFYAVYATLRWANQPTIRYIIPIALAVGFAMMSKLSGGMVAPAIALVFLWKWWESFGKKDGSFQKLFYQFALFGILCIPLALWWQVRNGILFDMPLTYVPALSENSGQFVGDYTTAQRLWEVNTHDLNNVFVLWQHQGAPYNEYNCFLALLKSSMFGEFTLFDANSTLSPHPLGIVACKTMFYTNLALVACSLWATLRVMTKKETRKTPQAWLLFLLLGVLLVSYLRFCFGYPQTCTQNFRYAVPTLLAGCGLLGVWLNTINNKFITIGIGCLAGVFALSTALCYTLLGLV